MTIIDNKSHNNDKESLAVKRLQCCYKFEHTKGVPKNEKNN